MSKASNIIDSFTGFVGHYAGEAKIVANALTSLLDAVRPNSAITAEVKDAINALETAADNISKAKAPTPVIINKADIEAAVAAVLPDMVAKAVADAMAKAKSA